MPNPLTLSDIAKEYQNFIHVQDYTKKPVIEGVKITEIRNFIGEDGDFSEVLRLTPEGIAEGFEDFKVRQINRSMVMPGTIKAWHFHLKQDEAQTVLPSDKLLIGLWDLREKSPTKDITTKLVFGGGKSYMVFIPRGVAHGYMNLSQNPATVFYFVSEQFTMDDPDELRLPWDSMGPDFWQITRE